MQMPTVSHQRLTLGGLMIELSRCMPAFEENDECTNAE